MYRSKHLSLSLSIAGMGRTQVDQSPAPDYSQMQSESETQPEEYQHGLENGTTGTPDEPYYNHENQQANYEAQPSNQPGNDPTMQATQQQFQPPPPPSYPQYPPQNPQTNPAYQNPPVLYPPPNPQTFPDNRIHPGQYQQQNLQPNPMYMGQTPSRSPPPPPPPPPQVNDIPQHFSQAGYYSTDQPVQFPPVDAQTYPPMPRPPYKPPVQPISATGIPIPGGWTTGLFDCMDDPTNALTTAFFPCLTFGQVAEIVEDGHTSKCLGIYIYIYIYRADSISRAPLRRNRVPNRVAMPVVVHIPELKNRGFDPSIGWLGNVSLMNRQQQQQAATMPPTMDRMMRS
ncbi:hypothetical protein HHK36_006969 [Tetracentron sinense]|uniref:Uncharacterized protein n=1 Tax=Tetracentron sinense TaxID=13715 RepID=A0A835DL80_TETSI|nr:hypothetical protein HHK36_006969 [Tetracentron sinense]